MKVGLLILGRRRPGFDPEWGAEIVEGVQRSADAWPFEAFRPPTPIVDEGTLRAAVAECRAAGVDAVVLIQPTMSDGNLAAALSQIWDGPPVLWATPEKPTGAMISSCSLVGAHTFASTLRQLGQPFELAYGMPGEADAQEQVVTALRLVAGRARLKRGKVGIVGYHAPGFIDMQADPFQLKAGIGLQLRHYGLQELQDAMNALDATAVAADIDVVKELGLPLVDVEESELEIASRYYLAMRGLYDEESLDALAVRCWSELPNVIGQWPYLAMVRLATEGRAIACEGDVDGAVSCMIGCLLGFGQGYLSDWLEHDRERVTLWHAGNAPLGLCEPVGSEFGPRITRHFNNRKAAVVDANLRSDMPVTVFRLWRCDNEYRLASYDGQTVSPGRPLMGTNGVAEVPGHDLMDVFDELCHEGMPHHVAVFEGHHTRTLKRFARLMKIRFIGG